MSNRSRDAAGVKATRIQKIHKMITGTGQLPMSRFLAIVEYQMGLSPDTTKRYLKTLEGLEFIRIYEETDVIEEVKPE